jgi:hypothetical protein
MQSRLDRCCGAYGQGWRCLLPESAVLSWKEVEV